MCWSSNPGVKCRFICYRLAYLVIERCPRRNSNCMEMALKMDTRTGKRPSSCIPENSSHEITDPQESRNHSIKLGCFKFGRQGLNLSPDRRCKPQSILNLQVIRKAQHALHHAFDTTGFGNHAAVDTSPRRSCVLKKDPRLHEAY